MSTCHHRIVDNRNDLVESGYICIDCGALVSAADHGPTKAATADAVDAARYRWLRNKGRRHGISVEEDRAYWQLTHTSSTLDALIDKFLKLEKEKQS